MMKVTSNIDEITALMEELHATFGFEVSVGNMSLGKRMAEKTAEMIQSRSVQFQKGANVQWEPNKEPYKSDKAKKYNVHDLAGVRTGQMLSQESLMGETHITNDDIEMTYGTNETPKRSVSSSYFSEADGKVTDRQKAEWFTEGRSGSARGRDSRGRFTSAGDGSQPERPFYELDADVADQVFDLVVEAVDKILKGP